MGKFERGCECMHILQMRVQNFTCASAYVCDGAVLSTEHDIQKDAVVAKARVRSKQELKFDNHGSYRSSRLINTVVYI